MRRWIWALIAATCLATGCSVVSGSRLPEFADQAPFAGPPTIVLPDQVVRIVPGEDVVATVERHPAGSTFVFEPGMHRLQRSIVARDGDTFFGEPGAVLNGAVPIEAEGREGGHWFSSDLDLDTSVHGRCEAASPRCGFRHDLFLDDRALVHVATRGELVPGTWTYDVIGGRAYWADDATGRRLEVSVATAAVSGDADDVTVVGLVIERFANPAQRGAVFAERVASATTYGQRWTIASNVVRWNHGVGIRAGGGAWIVDNLVTHNGQLGVASVGPGSTRIEANEIAYNNVAGFDYGWEAGGTKFVRTDGIVIRHNHVHHNRGPGLWTDFDNARSLIESNLVEHNADTGIFHEISYEAVIRSNEVRYNGHERGELSYAYVYGAGILVADSRDVWVIGNLVVGNWNGIAGVQQGRGSGALGPYVLRNLRVFDNDVTMAYHAAGVGPRGELGVPGVSGIVQSGGFSEVFSSAYDNQFRSNRYGVEDTRRSHFAWGDRFMNFAAWQGCGGTTSRWPGCRQDVGSLIQRDANAQIVPTR